MWGTECQRTHAEDCTCQYVLRRRSHVQQSLLQKRIAKKLEYSCVTMACAAASCKRHESRIWQSPRKHRSMERTWSLSNPKIWYSSSGPKPSPAQAASAGTAQWMLLAVSMALIMTPLPLIPRMSAPLSCSLTILSTFRPPLPPPPSPPPVRSGTRWESEEDEAASRHIPGKRGRRGCVDFVVEIPVRASPVRPTWMSACDIAVASDSRD